MKKVLIAVGDKSYTDILRDTFTQHTEHFSLSSQEVLHRRFLDEIVDLEPPEILVIHDYYLESDFTRNEMKEQELVSYFRKLRVQFDDSLRIVFLCERPKGDPFLSTLVSLGILDIFNSNAFDLDEFIEQLLDKPRFSRVEKFLGSSIPHASTGLIDAQDEEEEEEDKGTEEESSKKERKKKAEKQVVQKVIEKKIVQKVVNKNVIKRDYTVQVHNHTEKVVGIPLKKKLVMIGSPLERSGSTFISHYLARSLSQMGVPTTYVESPFSKAYTYDRFYGHLHADDYRSKFHQYSKYIDPKFNSVYDWSKNDVDIICKHPTNEPVYKEGEVNFENLIKVLFSTSSTVTIIDVGTDWEQELFQDVFDIADNVYFVFEPDIPFIQYFEESKEKSIQFLREQLSHEKSAIIGNRFDKQTLDSGLIQGMYKDRIKTIFPSLPVNEVFQSQLQGNFLNDYKDSQKRIELFIQPLLEDILPKEFIKKQKKGPGLLKGLFNKKITIEKTETSGEETNL